MTDPQYKAHAEGGFECVCGAVYETALGINRHRGMCAEYNAGADV